VKKLADAERRSIEAALRKMRRRLGIPEGRALSREEALEFITRPVALFQPSRPPRGRGRPPKQPKHLREAYERRRALYADLVLRPRNAVKGGRARQALGFRRREWVYDNAMKLIAARIAPHRLARLLAEASQAPGAPAMSQDRARRILRELGFRRP
jgi:hypothetical protein